MAANIAIPSTTAAAVSGTIPMASTDMIHVYSNVDLKVSEAVRLEVSPDDGTTWLPVVNEEYRGVVLSDTVQNQTVGGPGTYRLVKTATSVPVEIYFE